MKLKFNTLFSSALIAFSINAIAQTGTPTQIKYGSFVSVSLSGSAYQRDLAADASGNVYGVGFVKGLTAPPFTGTVTTASNPVFQTAFGGGTSDGYMYKLAADGKSVAWWSFLGGGGVDDIWGVEYAKEGVNEYLYIAGYTNANISIPTSKLISGASYKGGYEGFVAKINALNGQMMWFNWIGSTADDGAFTVKVSDNYIHVGGHASQNFPTSSNAYKKQLNNNFNWSHDGFYARYNNSGELNYSTLVGFESSGNDFMVSAPEGKKGVIGLEVISDDEVYLCGTTKIDGNNAFIKESSPLLPIDGVKATSTYNGFVMRLNVATSISPFASLIRGTSSSTLTNAVDIKKFGTYLYVLGMTKGGVLGGLPATAYQRTNKGGTDAYVLKIDISNYSINNASMFGGADDEYVGNLNVCTMEPTFSGQTASSDLPAIDYLTTGGLSSPTRDMNTYKGNSDYFFASLKSDFSSLTFATYLGGSGLEHSYNSDITGNNGGQALIGNDILFAASTHSKSDMPTTIGSWKHVTDAAVIGASGDLDFVVRFEKQGATCALISSIAPTIDLDFLNDSATGYNYKTTYKELGAIAVSIANTKTNGVFIDDSDSPNILGAAITLTNTKTADIFQVVGSLPSGISSSVVISGVNTIINLTGSATKADYETAIKQIYFSNSSNDPSGEDRIITVTVNDGIDVSIASTTTIKFVIINGTPSLDLDKDDNSGKTGADYQTNYYENGTAVSIADSDLSIIDDKSNLESATIVLKNLISGEIFGVFGTLPAGINVDTIYNTGTKTLQLKGSASIADYIKAIKLIKYSSSSDTLIADKVIEVIVTDGFKNSNLATAFIHFKAKNDCPSIDINTTTAGNDNALIYTENDGKVIITKGVSIIDKDKLAQKWVAQIVLTNKSSLDSLFAPVSANGFTVSNPIYTVATKITIDITGTGKSSDLANLISQITFRSGSENPVTTARVVSVEIKDDSLCPAKVNSNITIYSINDCPTLDVDGSTVGDNFTTTFNENGLAIAITGSSVLITDKDKATQAWIASAILTNAQVLDSLKAPLSANGFTVLTPVYGTGKITVNISGTGTATNLATLLKGIKFINTSDNPSTTVRNIDFSIKDDSLCTDKASATIAVVGINDAPQLDLDANNSTKTGSDFLTTFTENNSNITSSIVDIDVLVSDVDNTNINNVTINFTNVKTGDNLNIGFLPSGITSFVVNSLGNITITLSGSATKADYETALKAIVFDNKRDDVDTTTRVITFVVNDGTIPSNSATAYIKVINMNDTVIVTNENVVTNEDMKIIYPISTITANDVDPDNDLILVTLLTNSKHGNTIINGSNYEYIPNPFYFGEDTAIFNLCDAKGACKPDTLFITVEPVNSVLILDLDSADGGIETGNIVAFTVGGANVNISTNQNSIFNPDNIGILGAKFVITNKKNGDTLLINGVLPVGVSPSIVSSAGTLTLTITGNLDSTAYKNILKQIQFKNYRNNIDTSDRFIYVTVLNANGNSNIAIATIKIVKVIDNDTITITDSHFKSALINKGFDLNNDGIIQRKEIVNVHKLNLSNSSIADLAGIEAFVNLDTLIVSNNSLTSLNVKALTNLKYLDATYNKLIGMNDQNFSNQRLAVSNNTKLQTLLINNNNLTSLDVRNLASLKYLNAKVNNPLSVICVSEQHNLTYFTADLNVVYSTSCGLVTDADNEGKTTEKLLIKVYNLLGQEVNNSENISGIYIYYYSDGSTEKVMR